MWDLVGNPEDRFSHNEAHMLFKQSYRKDPKFSNSQVWANRADPDQTAPRGAV